MTCAYVVTALGMALLGWPQDMTQPVDRTIVYAIRDGEWQDTHVPPDDPVCATLGDGGVSPCSAYSPPPRPVRCWPAPTEYWAVGYVDGPDPARPLEGGAASPNSPLSGPIACVETDPDLTGEGLVGAADIGRWLGRFASGAASTADLGRVLDLFGCARR